MGENRQKEWLRAHGALFKTGPQGMQTHNCCFWKTDSLLFAWMYCWACSLCFFLGYNLSPVSHQSCSRLSPSFSSWQQEMKYPLLCLAGVCVMWSQMAAKTSIWECLHIIKLQLLFLQSEVMGGFPAATRSRWTKRDMSWWGVIKIHWDEVCSVPLWA